MTIDKHLKFPPSTHSSRIPVFSYLNPKFKPSVAVAPTAAIKSTSASPKDISPKPELRKFFGFLQKARNSDAAKKEKKSKKSKADKSENKNNASDKSASVNGANGATAAVALSRASNTPTSTTFYPAPFIPSKRIVQHHEYQNIADPDAAPIRMAEPLPVLRRFGDTNPLRIRNPAKVQPTVIASPALQQLHHYRGSIVQPAPLQRQHFANSTGDLLSLTASDVSTASSSTYGSGLKDQHHNQRGDDDQHELQQQRQRRPHSSSRYIGNEHNYHNQQQQQQQRKQQQQQHLHRKHNASNVGNAAQIISSSAASQLSSGSGTTLSDSNSLDSMEHEIVHRARGPSHQQSFNNKSSADQSYLGPFNFRQLLRPTQGPTESLRKRRGINLSLTPPPMQKGKA